MPGMLLREPEAEIVVGWTGRPFPPALQLAETVPGVAAGTNSLYSAPTAQARFHTHATYITALANHLTWTIAARRYNICLC